MPALFIPSILSGLTTLLGFIVRFMIRVLAFKIIAVLIAGFLALILVYSGAGTAIAEFTSDFVLNMLGGVFSDAPIISVQSMIDSLPNSVKYIIVVSRMPDILELWINVFMYMLSLMLFLAIAKVATRVFSVKSAINMMKGVS